MKRRLFYLKFLVLLALCGCNPDKDGPVDPDNQGDDNPIWGDAVPLPVISGEATFSLSGSDDYVNVMENYMPAIPDFPAVAKKEGMLRGFVADLSGRPLKGAYIGIRSSIIGGSYSSASAQTNDNGYYEILLPLGAVHFWAAGYSFNYGTGKAAMGLYSENGEAAPFQSTPGLVKNFVLLSCGLADEDERAERPWSSSGYFGGSLRISYDLGDPNDIWAPTGSLPYDAEIEITLVPKEGTLYGETKTFVINKQVGNLNFNINNIPVGSYLISARLKDGRALRLRHIGPDVTLYPHHGLKPKEAIGEAEVWFTAGGTAAESGSANHGSWRPVDIKVQLPDEE